MSLKVVIKINIWDARIFFRSEDRSALPKRRQCGERLKTAVCVNTPSH